MRMPDGRALSASELVAEAKINPELVITISGMNPSLAQLVLDEKVDEIQEYIERNAAAVARIRRLEARLAANPYDVEAQREMEEEIRQRNVAENLAHAMEHNPEAFGSVHMLYVNTVVNNVPVKAFVDSGAQSTIMSESCAERCGIMRLIDTRFAGTAVGVGSAPIVGRVHAAPVVIGGQHFISSFTVLRSEGVDFLLGLDNLKRHEACIDLKENVLRIGATSVEFLPESELPKSAFNPGATRPTPPASPTAAAGSNTTTTTTTTTSTSAPSAASTTASDDAIAQILALGYSHEQAVRALSQTNNDVEFAINLLLSQSPPQ